MSNVLLKNIDSSFKEISIETKKSRPFLLIILLCLAGGCIIFPFFILFLTESKIGFGYIITLIIFLGSSIFFIRLFLWNKYGKEVYEVKKDTIAYYYDYRFFRDNKRELSFIELQIGFLNTKNSDELLFFESESNKNFNDNCYLVFISEGNLVKSNIPISYKDLKGVVSILENKV